MGENRKKILYVDLDNTLVDFRSGIDQLDPDVRTEFEGNFDEAPGIFGTMTPLPGEIEAFVELSMLFDAYILSTAPWLNPSAWSDKLLWSRSTSVSRRARRSQAAHPVAQQEPEPRRLRRRRSNSQRRQRLHGRTHPLRTGRFPDMDGGPC